MTLIAAMRKKFHLAVLLPTVALSGCAALVGTFAESGPNKVFIGTRTDAQSIAHGCPNASPCMLPRPVAIVDLPLSLVVDSLFLVYTVPYSLAHEP